MSETAIVTITLFGMFTLALVVLVLATRKPDQIAGKAIDSLTEVAKSTFGRSNKNLKPKSKDEAKDNNT